MAKKHTPKQLLTAWKNAYDKSDKSNPLSLFIESELNLQGMSTYDIQLALNDIKGTATSDLTKEQKELVFFFNRTNHLREQFLVDRVSTNVKGQMFLLQSKFGYTPSQKIETDGKTNVVIEFGCDD